MSLIEYKEEHLHLYNGDCLDVMDKLIADNVHVDIVIADIPYGTTKCSWDLPIPVNEMWDRINKIVKKDGIAIIFGSEPFSSLIRVGNLQNYRYDIKWDKIVGGGFLNAKKKPLTVYEDIMIFSTGKLGNFTYNPIMTRKKDKDIRKTNKTTKTKVFEQGIYNKFTYKSSEDYNIKLSHPKDIIQFNVRMNECNMRKRVHPTQKPIKLIEYLLHTYSNKNDLVLDFVMGSCTTGIACKNLSRQFIGIDSDKHYFDISVNRVRSISKSLL